jgi:hypothetical protein
MLSGTMLSRVIHAEREREIERRTRDLRLLERPETTVVVAGPAFRDPAAIGRTTRTERRGPSSSGSAVEPV